MRILNLPLTPIVHVSSDYKSGFFTDHNRGELDVSYDELGNVSRAASGALRGYVVARKRQLSLSWTMVPADAAITIDGYWSAREIEEFYLNTLGTFRCKLYHRDSAIDIDNPLSTFDARITDFSMRVIKRNVPVLGGQKTDLCDMTFSWEEV